MDNRGHLYSLYYIEKTAADAQKQQKLNVINYKHEYML